jgi:hypothetical protein
MDITTILLQIELFSKQLETTSLTTIERDLIKSKLLSLYEKVSLSNPVQMPIVPTLEQSTPPALEVPKVELTPMPVEEKTLPKVEEPVAVVEKIVEPVIERVPAPTIVEAPVVADIPEVQKVAVQETPPSAPYKEVSLIDRLSETDNSLMGKFTTSSKGLNDNVTEGDLKKLIDFNRQFVFIQELFGNDPKAYMEAINRLNTIQTIEEAVKYINQELVPKYNWNKDLQSLKLFDKIIRQKFGI